MYVRPFFFGKCFQLFVDFGYQICLACQSFITAETFVDRKQALQVKPGVGRLFPDALYRHANHTGDAVGCQVVRNIVHTDKQE